LLDEELDMLPEDAPLPGKSAFKLYDTYGFPLDLTQDALREKGRTVDTDGFDTAMEEQKAKARASWAGSGEAADASVWFDIADAFGATDFLGYDTENAEGQILAIVRDGARVEELAPGETGWVVLNQTPFYAESGGQVADHGYLRLLENEDTYATCADVQKMGGRSVYAHKITVSEEGPFKVGDSVALEVMHERRSSIRANHSATHLLHEAVRGALGEHVAQRGSLNAEDRLRFDFSHGKALSLDELAQVEVEVNTYIRQNAPVETRIMTPDDARDIGAQALFGEKYGDEVRVVSMGRANTGKGLDGNTYSIELCGGTHVRQTGDIGVFVALGDSASSSGVRRIEALTGEAAFTYLREQDRRLAETALALKARPEEVGERVRGLLDERKALQAEVAQLRRDLAMGGTGGAVKDKDINGVAFFSQILSGVSGKDLKALVDEHKARLGSGAVLLIADTGGKAAVTAGVTKDLVDRISAVDLVKAAVVELGGKGGGGRPDMAQGGGKDVAGAEAAIEAAQSVIGG
ncbi:MAG: alanine--tRNA ligase, partial [Litoreibacter sp.]|nr:alanine--tRNA ligase [Litoreibacter sp.]